MRPEDATRLIDSLYEHWYDVLVRYAARAVGDEGMAEDAVQESFYELYRQLVSGRSIANPKAWTLCVVRRHMQREVRAYSRMFGGEPREGMDSLPGSASPPDGALQRNEIERFRSQLTCREEEVLLLRMEALKYREIASKLGISIPSVNTLLRRALRKLQLTLGAPSGKTPHVETGN